MFAVAETPMKDGGPRRREGHPAGHPRSRRAFRPDLDDCLLEDRLTPIVPNLGVIVLTTGGYMLLTPFPGAFVSPSGAGAGPITASSVSGTPFNLPFFILGGGGISSGLPGNITGVPILGNAAPSGSTAAASQVIYVGSGAEDANAPVIPLVTRNTIANDRLNPPPLIGGQPTSTSSLLPPPAAPAPAPAPPTSGTAGGPTMPPPGSSLSGPFVRFPSMLPRTAPLGFPAGTPLGGPWSGPAPITPPPAPGSGLGGPSAGRAQ